MTIAFPSAELGLIVVVSALAGFLLRDVLAGRTATDHLEAELRLHIARHVLEAAHGVAVEMLDEDDRMDEFETRAQERLDELADRMDERNELARIDPIGAQVLGPDREPVRFPPERED